jgi:hypothetical protein
VGAATAFADDRDRSAAAPVPAPGARSDGVPAHRNGETSPAQVPGTTAPRPEAAHRLDAAARPEDTPAVPRVPIVDANPRPDPADRFPAPAGAAGPDPGPVPADPPDTVDLRGDGLVDPVRHDDDPPVPAGPVAAGEPGRP